MLDDASPDAMPAPVQRQVSGDAPPRRVLDDAAVRSADGGTVPTRVLPEQSALTRARSRMDRALAVARDTPAGDIPVGAVVFGPSGTPIAAATNRRQADNDPTAHAEVLALRAAAEKLGRWRLEDCELVVTLEPCVMCAGAAVAARVWRVGTENRGMRVIRGCGARARGFVRARGAWRGGRVRKSAANSQLLFRLAAVISGTVVPVSFTNVS